MQDFGTTNLPGRAENFKSIIEADEEDHFNVEGELKQLSTTTFNRHTNNVIRHI